jgi:hypothetical protein
MTKDEALKLAKSWFEANTYGDEAVEVYEAIEQALAAQPASEADMEVYRSIADNYRKDLAAAQPAVPDAIHHTDLSEHPQYIQGWNDCRAEMLKGMKP